MGTYDLCVQAYAAGDWSQCKPFGFDLVGWAAIAVPVFGVVLYFARKGWGIFTAAEQPVDSRTIRRSVFRDKFKALGRQIEPIIDDNYRIFSTFGPISGKGEPINNVVRYNIDIWRQKRIVTADNNKLIKQLIEANRSSIPIKYKLIMED